MPKLRTKEQMAAYQRRHRNVTPDVTPPENVTPEPENHVTPSVSVTPGVTPGTELRAQLDDLKARYVGAQRVQDWETCGRVNAEREPLFARLWALERDLPSGERYWFPVRFGGVAVPK